MRNFILKIILRSFWSIVLLRDAFAVPVKKLSTTNSKFFNGTLTKSFQSCPNFQTLPDVTVTHECRGDEQCVEGRICCPTAMGRRCLKLPSAGQSVNVIGVGFSAYNPHFKYDDDKPGDCPRQFEANNRALEQHRTCQADKDCPGQKKCCPTTTDQAICMLPQRPMPENGQMCMDGSEPFGRCEFFTCPYGYECQSGACCRILKLGDCPPSKRAPGLRMLSAPGEPCDCDCDCVDSYKCCIYDGDALCTAPFGRSEPHPNHPKNGYSTHYHPWRGYYLLDF